MLIIYKEIFLNKTVHILCSLEEQSYVNILVKITERLNQYALAGFDCEWAENEKISLIQIAFPDGFCLLIRILNSISHIPIEILNWLKDKSKLKFGVNVIKDKQMLSNDWEIDVQGCCDLRFLATQLRSNNLPKMGLKSFSEFWLGIEYTENLLSSRRSNWSQQTLTSDQIDYACLDALVGALCTVEFLQRKLEITYESAILQLDRITEFCSSFVDCEFKPRKLKGTTPFKLVVLESYAGEEINISLNKANDLIKIHLVEKISEDPLKIKLLDHNKNTDFFCVVCEKFESCGKHKLIPDENYKLYSKDFKESIKNIKISLCSNCEKEFNKFYELKKKKIIFSPISEAIKAAKRIIFQKNLNSEDEILLKSVISQYHKIEAKDLTNEIIKYTSGLKDKTKATKISVKNFQASSEDFQMWKTYFIDVMKPKLFNNNNSYI